MFCSVLLVQCTFINPISAQHCVMCQTAQPLSAAAPAATAAATASPLTSPHRLVSQPTPAAASAHQSRADDDDDEDEDEDEGGWDDGEDDGDESFQRPHNSSFAVSDEKATALHAQFSEVCQLLKPAAESDDGKRRKRKSSSGQQADDKRVKELITAVYTTHVLPSVASSAVQSKRGRKKKVQCEVCYEEAAIVTDLTSEQKSDEDGSYALTLPGCQHYQVCTTCMAGHIESKVTSADVAAWVSCPHEKCTTPLHPNVLCYPGLLTTELLLRLLLGYLTKLLSRSTAFVRCSTSHCLYGFVHLDKKKQTRACPLCHKEQAVERGSEGELDESFKRMIASGTLRACPTCSHFTLKEKGICNVIECAKCGVWWNWRTRETGKSGTELKAKARAMGTLWEQGELQYQMELERRQPDEFKKLLERNGMVSAPQSFHSISFPTLLQCPHSPLLCGRCALFCAGVRSELQTWWLVMSAWVWKHSNTVAVCTAVQIVLCTINAAERSVVQDAPLRCCNATKYITYIHTFLHVSS